MTIPIYHSSEESLKALNEAAIPGAFWLQTRFLFLKYVPIWFPEEKAAHWREVSVFAMWKTNYMISAEEWESWAIHPSSRVFMKNGPMEEKLAQDVTAIAYINL